MLLGHLLAENSMSVYARWADTGTVISNSNQQGWRLGTHSTLSAPPLFLGLLLRLRQESRATVISMTFSLDKLSSSASTFPGGNSAGSYSSFLEKGHFSLLDGIRGMSILAVIWHHSGGEDPFQSAIFGRGYLGVDLFFILSGFLITHLLIKEKRREGSVSLKNFYIRRSLRIFPLYYAYLAFMMIWAWSSSPEKLSEYSNTLPYYLLYVSNWLPESTAHFFEHSWSLAVEEQFYLLWPMVFIALGSRNAFSFIAAVILASLGGMLFLAEHSLPEIVDNLVPFRTLLIGCALALLLNNEDSYNWLARLCANAYLPVALMLVFILVIQREGAIEGVERVLVHTLMFLFVACSVINERNVFGRVLQLRLLQLCGAVSYGIYILHGLLWGVSQKLAHLVPLEQVAQSRLTFFLAFAVTSGAVAYISFHFYEKHFLKLKNRFYQKAPIFDLSALIEPEVDDRRA